MTTDTNTAPATPGPMERKLLDVFAGLTIPPGVANGWYELRPFAREQDEITADLLAALKEAQPLILLAVYQTRERRDMEAYDRYVASLEQVEAAIAKAEGAR